MMGFWGEPKRACLPFRLTMMLAIVCLFVLCVCPAARAEQAPLLAAASSLRNLWPELVDHYEQNSSLPAPKASFASSGLLSTQILNGAPFELFLSADMESIERLPAELLAAGPQSFALGELLLVAPKAAGILAENLSMETLTSAFSRDEANADNASSVPRLTIANPQHAPYGKAAREALVAASLWPLPPAQLLLAENAAQTLQFINTGAVSAALIPQVLLTSVTSELATAAVPADTYSAVQHTAVLLKGATAAADAFYQWLLSDDAHQPLLAAGLKLP